MTVNADDNLIGFYARFNFQDKDQELVKSYLWGENGLNNKLDSLKWMDFGQDFHLILFQFYVKPIPDISNHFREIENYRRKEKSIGIPVIIDNSNFFNLSETDRQKFFSQIILDKLELLREKIKRNKLDLKIDKLKTEIKDIFNNQ